MKKILFTLFTIIGLTAIAQQEAPPQGINYQAVVYSDNGNNQPGLNSPGQVLWNQDITMRFAVYQGEDNPILVYEELHAITTDEFGMVSLVIGQGVPQGTQLFETINWGGGSHFLRVDVDKNAGINFESMSYQKLWSVPYALYSEESNSSNFSDSSDYSNTAGNGITGVSDNGDGTLTFTYFDGSVYTTAVLSGMQGPQGEIGPEGPAGIDGQDGLSAYDAWLAQGNTGTQADFLNGITGPQGPAGTNGIDGATGQDGQNGLSAYEVWISQGNTGTEVDFLNGITGPQGPQGPAGTNGVDGTDGQDGLSAYEVWLSQGNTGTEADFLTGITGAQGPVGTNGVDGTDGQDGLSAYEVWLSQGNTGSEADFLNGITGPQGPAGTNGVDGVDGATGPAGADGNGISSIEDNGNGTVTILLTDGSSEIISLQDNDDDPINEIQSISLVNDTLILSNPNGSDSIYLNTTSNQSSAPMVGNSFISLDTISPLMKQIGNGVEGDFSCASFSGNLNGEHYYKNFTVESFCTLSIQPAQTTIIHVSDTCFIYGTINGNGSIVSPSYTEDRTQWIGAAGSCTQSPVGQSCSYGTFAWSYSPPELNQLLGYGHTKQFGSWSGSDMSLNKIRVSTWLGTNIHGYSGNRTCGGTPTQCTSVTAQGGAGLIIIARVLVFNGQITLNGSNGQQSGWAASGAGGGGSLVLSADDIISNVGNVSVLGGNGGGDGIYYLLGY